jgi:hypothetical protein
MEIDCIISCQMQLELARTRQRIIFAGNGKKMMEIDCSISCQMKLELARTRQGNIFARNS